MVGCWESLIKTIKQCLSAILKNIVTTVETLTTVLYELDYIVDNRPVLPISDSIIDYNVLKPNNFLLDYKSCGVNVRNGVQVNQRSTKMETSTKHS